MFFLPISVFHRKRNIKRIPNGMKPLRGFFWNKRNPGDLKWTSWKQRGGHEVGGCAPTLVGPSQVHRHTSFAYIYSYTLETPGGATKPIFHCRNLLYPWDPILGPLSVIFRRGNRSRRASTSTPLPLRWSVTSLPIGKHSNLKKPMHTQDHGDA